MYFLFKVIFFINNKQAVHVAFELPPTCINCVECLWRIGEALINNGHT